MKVVILAGGTGARAYPYTEYIPKPMLPIVGTPIIMHVMKIYAEQGYNDFILSLGYRKEVILDYFDKKMIDWNVELVDTGDNTLTGGRIYNCRDKLTEPFFATYADGLATVPLDGLNLDDFVQPTRDPTRRASAASKTTCPGWPKSPNLTRA